VRGLAAAIPTARVLVNNAGGARGLEPVEGADEQHWRWMWDTNVLGTPRVTQALLPALIASGAGHIVAVTSLAAFETSDNGAGDASPKHAQGACPARRTPSLVHTEFSLVRFDGEAERADQVYAGLTPLTAEDVADVIEVADTRPSSVNLDLLVLKPRDQVSATRVHRRG
jgi:NADP-dependent 3-hydroxy acid dehydrogenase YdfG